MPLIVLEGLDGAGKTTQTELLKERLESRGFRYEYLHFPRFDAPVYGGLIARFLRGELGGFDAVDPYLVALLFAGDRADAAAMIRKWLARGKYVLLDRYVNSNIAYQCAKVEGGEAREMLRRWILDLEYGHNAIPRMSRSFWTCRSALPSAASPHHAAARTGGTWAARTTYTKLRSLFSGACGRFISAWPKRANWRWWTAVTRRGTCARRSACSPG